MTVEIDKTTGMLVKCPLGKDICITCPFFNGEIVNTETLWWSVDCRYEQKFKKGKSA